MSEKQSVKCAWVRDSKTRWLRLSIAVARRYKVLGMIGRESKRNPAFLYLDPNSAIKALSALKSKGVDVTISEPKSRYNKLSPVRSMANFEGV